MIAILVSGAIRNFEELWPQNKVILDSLGLPYKVFIHTWTENYGTTRKVYSDVKRFGFHMTFKPQSYVEDNFQITTKKLNSIVPNSKVSVDNFNEANLIKLFSIPSRESTALYQNFVNSIAAFEGITRVCKLVASDSDYENFNHFLRIRTDFELTRDFNITSFDYQIFFGGTGTDTDFGYVSDQFFIMDREVFEVISTACASIRQYVDTHGWQVKSATPFYGEKILAYLLRDVRLGKHIYTGQAVGKIRRPKTALDTKKSKLNYFIDVVNFNLYLFGSKLINLFSTLRRRISNQ
jgi:hypothetical protein